MTYPRAVLLAYTLALLLALLLAYDVAQAEGLTVDLGLGLSHFQKTSVNGDWYQDALPNAWELKDMAYKVGASYEWQHWGISTAMVSFGSVKNLAGFVGDEHFDPKNNVCLAMCDKLSWLEVSDAVRAYELVGSYCWHLGQWSPCLRAGGAILTHRFTVTNGPGSQQLYGRMPATVLGVSLCYGERVKGCLEPTYYNTVKGLDLFGKPSNPLFENILATFVTIKVPVTW